MSEREEPYIAPLENQACIDRLMKEPGFYEEFAHCLIIVCGGEVVKIYRADELMKRFPVVKDDSADKDVIGEVINVGIREDLASQGIDLVDGRCTFLQTYPIRTVSVGISQRLTSEEPQL